MTGEQATAALPKVVRVGPFDFAIVLDNIHESNGKRQWGECSLAAQTIHIQADMPTPIKAIDTFFHEVGHAIHWAYGILDEDKEERVVGAWATAIVALHRDNPWIADWIKTVMAET